MSANAGTVKASLEGDATSFIKSMQDGAKEVEKLSQRMKKLANDFAMLGGAVVAGSLAIARSAAEVNIGAARSFERFTSSSQTLAIQLSKTLRPAIDGMSNSLRETANWFAGLSPATQRSISDFVVLAVKVAAAGLIFGRLMGVVSGVAGVLSTVFGIIGAIGAGPIALITVGVVGLVAAIALMRKAWNEDWGGIRETVKGVIEDLSKWWTQFAGWLGDLWSGIVDDLASKVKSLVTMFYSLEVATGRMDERTAGLQMGAINRTIGAAAGVAKDPHAVAQLVLEAGQAVKKGAIDIVGEFKDLVHSMIKTLGLESKGGHAEGPADISMIAYGDTGDRKTIRKGTRIGQTSTATGGQKLTPSPETFDDIMKDLKQTVVDAWDKSDWSGVFKGVGNMILEDLSNLEEIGSAFKTVGMSMLSKLGQLGSTIQAGVQGFQQGGIWGAIGAVLLEIMSQAKGWQSIIDIGNGQLKTALSEMGKGISDFIGGFREIMGGVGSITHALHGILSPVLSLLGTVLKGIAPLFEFIGIALQPVGDALGAILPIINGILRPVLQALGWALTGVAEIILGVEAGIGMIWDAIKVAMVDFLSALNIDASWVNQNMGDINVMAITQQMQDLWAHGLGGLADSSADAAEQLGKTATAAQEVTQQLLNVPQGFKVALAEFNATQAVAMTSSGGGAGANPYMTQGSARERFLKTGNPVPMGLFPRNKP